MDRWTRVWLKIGRMEFDGKVLLLGLFIGRRNRAIVVKPAAEVLGPDWEIHPA